MIMHSLFSHYSVFEGVYSFIQKKDKKYAGMYDSI